MKHVSKTVMLFGLQLVLFSSCMTIDLDLEFVSNEEIRGQIMDQESDRYPHLEPLYISDEVKLLIDSIVDAGDSDELKVDKLQDILYGEDFLFMQYSDVKTHTALEAFHAREGNCLSVINLYIAMARYVGVDAKFQTVDVQPSWDRRGGLLILSQHINATGRLSLRRRYVVDFTPQIALQQMTSDVITDREARALYFNNLAVEELIAGNTDQALLYFKNALFLHPSLSIAWNNIGTSYNRLANREFAEYSYRMAFETDDGNATAINNLAKFYRADDNLPMARQFEEAIKRFNDRNPYYHFTRGNVAYRDRDLERARRSYSKALRMKREEPDFYLALALVYIELGDIKRAEDLNDSAKELMLGNQAIYRPSSRRMRIIDSASILRNSSPGLSIQAPGVRPVDRR